MRFAAKPSSLLVLAVLLSTPAAAVLLAQTARAADGKMLGAQICELGPAAAGTFLRHNLDGIEMAGASGTVVCTMVRDNVTNTNGLSDVELTVFDPSAGGSVVCDLVAQDRNGSPLKIVRRSSTRNGVQTLDWGGSMNLSASKGTYSFICNLPPGARLSSIYFNEF